MVPDDDEHLVRLPEHRLTKFSAQGEPLVSASVHCPIKACAQAVSACQWCSRLERPLDGALLCRVPVKVSSPRGVAGELLREEVVVLDPELPASRGLEVLEAAGVPWAPVVDDNGVLVGLAATRTLRDLARSGDAEVEDALQAVVALNQRASVLELARVMTDHGPERVLIVDDDGRLLGLVTAVDVVCWLLRPS